LRADWDSALVAEPEAPGRPDRQFRTYSFNNLTAGCGPRLRLGDGKGRPSSSRPPTLRRSPHLATPLPAARCPQRRAVGPSILWTYARRMRREAVATSRPRTRRESLPSQGLPLGAVGSVTPLAAGESSAATPPARPLARPPGRPFMPPPGWTRPLFRSISSSRVLPDAGASRASALTRQPCRFTNPAAARKPPAFRHETEFPLTGGHDAGANAIGWSTRVVAPRFDPRVFFFLFPTCHPVQGPGVWTLRPPQRRQDRIRLPISFLLAPASKPIAPLPRAVRVENARSIGRLFFPRMNLGRLLSAFNR